MHHSLQRFRETDESLTALSGLRGAVPMNEAREISGGLGFEPKGLLGPWAPCTSNKTHPTRRKLTPGLPNSSLQGERWNCVWVASQAGGFGGKAPFFTCLGSFLCPEFSTAYGQLGRRSGVGFSIGCFSKKGALIFLSQKFASKRQNPEDAPSFGRKLVLFPLVLIALPWKSKRGPDHLRSEELRARTSHRSQAEGGCLVVARVCRHERFVCLGFSGKRPHKGSLSELYMYIHTYI